RGIGGGNGGAAPSSPCSGRLCSSWNSRTGPGPAGPRHSPSTSSWGSTEADEVRVLLSPPVPMV
ncbi:hypothetical protein GTV15_03005, partial [Streptomyces sp. SID7803]|nr:hypothetical protein [Streptomyces sp. SID7803]